MRVHYVFFIILLGGFLVGCSSNDATLSPSPSPMMAPTPYASYSGVILSSELPTLEDEVEEFAQIIRDFESLENLEATPIYINEQNDWAIFRCNQIFHNSIGSFTDYRICGINHEGSRQQILAQQVYITSVSPDGEWIALGGDTENHLTDCKNQVYVMRVDGT